MMKRYLKLNALLLFVAACSKDRGEDFGPYYELSFADSVSAVVAGSSANVVLTQIPISLKVKQEVPFELRNESSLLDTVKLMLDVMFGSYSPTPSPQKSLTLKGDTLSLWYGLSAQLYKLSKQSSNNTLTQAATSPLPTYYSVQKVVIRKSPNKTVTFQSRFP